MNGVHSEMKSSPAHLVAIDTDKHFYLPATLATVHTKSARRMRRPGSIESLLSQLMLQ